MVAAISQSFYQLLSATFTSMITSDFETISRLTRKVSELDWRELKDSSRWVMGWR